jgi:hypothetical protein
MGDPGSDVSESACAPGACGASRSPLPRSPPPLPRSPAGVAAAAAAAAAADDDDEALSAPLAPALAELITLSFLSVSRSGPASPAAACSGGDEARAAKRPGSAPPQPGEEHPCKRRLSVSGSLDDAACGSRDDQNTQVGFAATPAQGAARSGGGRLCRGALHRWHQSRVLWPCMHGLWYAARPLVLPTHQPGHCH